MPVFKRNWFIFGQMTVDQGEKKKEERKWIAKASSSKEDVKPVTNVKIKKCWHQSLLLVLDFFLNQGH